MSRQRQRKWPLLAVIATALGAAPVASASHLGAVQLAHPNSAGTSGITTVDCDLNDACFAGRNSGGGDAAWGVGGYHLATTGTGAGIYGLTDSTSAGARAVFGHVRSLSASALSSAVYGLIESTASYSTGVRGRNAATGFGGFGVFGEHAGAGIGVYGEAPSGFAVSGFSPGNWSGYFQGSVRVVGNLQKNSGSFTIDHPLDPENKYLSHSFVESPDMKNVYDGVVTTDAKGFATVMLPRYFSELNRDFRYQLTSLSGLQNVAVAKKIHNNRFVLQSEKPFAEVSWQVTGIRKDRWANAHRIVVEEAKKPSERGKYLNPELYGKSATKSVVVLPGMARTRSVDARD